MESGSGPQSPRPEGEEGQPPPGPQSPAPGPPPPPPGPQSPAPGAPPAPQAPAGPEVPGQGPSEPPGGWNAPVAQQGYRPPGQLAGWGARAGALVVDALILLIPTLVLIIVVVAVALSSDVGGIVVGVISFLAYLVAFLFYAPVLMARGGERNGQTWGKQVLGIRVVRDSGQPFDLAGGFVREFVVKGLLFGFVGSFFASIPTLVNFLWPLWDDQNRALHDMLVKTHVVRA